MDDREYYALEARLSVWQHVLATSASIGIDLEPFFGDWDDVVTELRRLREAEARWAAESRPDPALDLPIAELGLCVRSRRRLIDGGIRLIGQLVGQTVEDLREMPGFGEVSLHEVRVALAERGLRLRGDTEPVPVGRGGDPAVPGPGGPEGLEGPR